MHFAPSGDGRNSCDSDGPIGVQKVGEEALPVGQLIHRGTEARKSDTDIVAEDGMRLGT